jgi:plasmid stabilization system protein ParE
VPDIYRVNITDEALANLETIFNFIQEDSPATASSVIEHLLDAIDDLDYLPGRFHPVGRSRNRGSTVHARVVRPFVVYYRIDQKVRTVFIVEVRHGARRQPRRFRR